MRNTVAFVWIVAVVTASSSAQDRLTGEQLRLFETKIRPVLVEHCYECHSSEADELGGRLRLDTRGGLRAGGESGPAVVPERPGSSLLLLAIKHTDENLVMPPLDYGDPLPTSVIADFERWIRLGAPDPREDGEVPDPIASDEARSWWAWQPVLPTEPPEVSDPQWARNAIDRFVFAKLQQASLSPSPQADRVTLVRRLAIDLTGLPPSMADLNEYALSDSPGPIEDLVDRYLDSEQYGERMGRHWLDVARYAESTGKDLNVSYPHAWRYRDYVVDAFNSDLPLDRFLVEQLAGDQLPYADDWERGQNIIATGFLAIGPKSVNEMNPRQFAMDVADEQIDAVSQALLGVTIACARCHDHKFDPISQRDYTAMAGIFLSTDTRFGTPGGVAGRNRSTLLQLPESHSDSDAPERMSAAALERLVQQVDALETRRRELAVRRRSGEADATDVRDILRVQLQLVRAQMRLESVDDEGTPKALAMGVVDKPQASSSRFRQRFTRTAQRSRRSAPELQTIYDSPQLIRGELTKPGETVPRGLPQFLAAGYDAEIQPDQSGRLQLAQWITDEANPLTARVMVNRIWSWLIGEGIVLSVDNFGTSGDLPSNQPLLDYLAAELVAGGWSTKKLVRQIVLSKTYQQSSAHRPDAFLVDPENRLVWRANRRSLDAESLRDGLLFASGRLDYERPRGSMMSAAGDGLIGSRRNGISEEMITSADPPYRSIYLPVPRNVLPDSLELFDFADNSLVDGARDLTIVPSQALYWMNSSRVESLCRSLAGDLLHQESVSERRGALSRARRFARQARSDLASADSQLLSKSRIEELFEQLSLKILSRPPLVLETRATVAYVRERQRAGKSQEIIWAGVCRSLLASSDYRFLN